METRVTLRFGFLPLVFGLLLITLVRQSVEIGSLPQPYQIVEMRQIEATHDSRGLLSLHSENPINLPRISGPPDVAYCPESDEHSSNEQQARDFRIDVENPERSDGLETPKDLSISSSNHNSETAASRTIRNGVRHSRINSCSICLDEYVEVSEAVLIPCGHGFHKDCLIPWLRRKPSCPDCRQKVPEGTLEQLLGPDTYGLVSSAVISTGVTGVIVGILFIMYLFRQS
ncbi:hypothetical protein KEM48_010290 [Puccinia striiformis f. sp. tritici PST-130]|nr:hypothetical protein KEM48_010290 [Puccinia striiformis f. sp. tritici PST-130]